MHGDQFFKTDFDILQVYEGHVPIPQEVDWKMIKKIVKSMGAYGYDEDRIP